MFSDFPELIQVVVGNQRFVSLDLSQCLPVLNGVRKNDFVPNIKVFVLFLEVLDESVNLLEFIVRSHIEARAFLEQGSDDLRVGIGFHRVIALNPRQVFLENPIILSYFGMVQDE
jgi:hypothetical protein